MKKLRQITAGIGAFLLAAMYLCTLIFAIIDNPSTMGFFKASVALTILVPVICYTIILFTKLSGKDSSDNSDDHSQH